MPSNQCVDCGTHDDLVKDRNRFKNLCKACQRERTCQRRLVPGYVEQVNANRSAARRVDPRKQLLSNAKARAVAQGVPCTISLEDIIVPECCPALGIPLAVQSKTSDNSPSLDNIVPALGYVPGNIVVVSHLANRIKSNATPDQLLAVAHFYKELK